MDVELVQKAVEALQAHHATVKKKKKPNLIEDVPFVSLIISLKKIPNRTIRPHRIPLTHSLYPPGEMEMCLFTKNDKSSVKELLEAKKVKGVSKVIPISKLKTNYKSFEAKRQLSSRYDVFLTDKRIFHMLPRLLGKKFFQKKKFPFPVDTRKKDLAQEIHAATDSTYLHIGLGSCCAVLIGKINTPSNHLIENILSGMRGIVNRIPRGWRNIQSVHLKSIDSIALPIYNSLPLPPTALPSVDELNPPVVASLPPPSPEPPIYTPEPSTRTVKKIRSMSTKKVRGSTIKSDKSVKRARRKTMT